MKRILLASAALTLWGAGAEAKTLGVSMANSENFLVVVRNAMEKEVAAHPGTTVQFLDAENDAIKQQDQVRNLISQKVDAIIVNPVDSTATPKLTQAATAAHIPIVYVNRPPQEEKLPPGVVFVGSDEHVSGVLEAEAMFKMMDGKGNVAILEGELSTVPAILRTQDVEDVAKKSPCIKITHKDAANFLRTPAIDVVSNWITTGEKIDAIAANNDEMAIGAVIALKQAKIDPKTMLIGGIDATTDGLAEIANGDMKVTVFQDAAGQGQQSVASALKLADGEHVESYVWVPFQLVTHDNYKQFMR